MIYFLERKNGDIKIGFTTGGIHGRKAVIETRHGKLELLGVMDGLRHEESVLHSRFNEAAVSKERVGEREWFRPIPELLAFIESNTRKEYTPFQKPIHLPPMKRPSGAKHVEIVIRLDELMKVAHVTLDDVADGTGVNQSALSYWHRNKIRTYNIPTMEKICHYFGCDVSDLLGLAEKHPRP